MTTDENPADDRPPVHRYELTLTIRGDTLDEIEHELVVQTRGGFLLDSDYGKRDEWNCIGGTVTSRMKQLNPDMTPERYATELDAWWQARKAARDDQ